MGRKSILASLSETLVTIIADVADDPRRLKPGQLCKILNGTPQGEAINDRRLRIHRERAGHRIGDGKTIDLIRYAAWLCSVRDRTPRPPGTEMPVVVGYGARKERERERNAKQSRSGRDIGPIPEVVDPKRKAKAKESLRVFLESYFPQRFKLAWSRDHLKVIDKIERAVLHGGLFALAMPRGSGKTTISECAMLWAVLYGFRQFGVLIGASGDSATNLIDSLKAELDTNDLLLDDFPEVCFPIRALEGITNRAPGQHCCGEPTNIGWKGKRIVLPTIKGSLASGAIIVVRSLQGAIRGLKFTRADGQSVRPDFVIPDDPQTDASARSELQCRQRSKTLATSVMGLAGPGKKITAVMPCTVIRKGDLASEYLDRNLHPEWAGDTCKLVLSFPTNEDLWAEYMRIRDDDLRNDGDGSKATAFYKKNRKAMDAGAEVSWPERYEPGQISGIQYAMDLYLSIDPEKVAAFHSEYQNDPQDTTVSSTRLEASAISSKVSGLDASRVPAQATIVTSMIDVQHNLLYWLVAAWGDGFTGSVLHYGTWPDQPTNYFNSRSAQRTFAGVYPGLPLAAQIQKALTDLVPALLARKFVREDGTEMRISRLLIDAADGHVTDPVCDFIRAGNHGSIVRPSRGVGIGPADKPLSEYFRKEGERHGDHWIEAKMAKRTIQHVRFDANYWKSQMAQGLAAQPGQRGCITLYGTSQTNHRLLADHATSERGDQMSSDKTGRKVEVWTLMPSKTENHFWDCLVGSAVAASTQGISFSSIAKRKPTKKSERQAVTYIPL